ncbi:site-specific integrase [Brucella anthropi]|uniref:site-specific integrase n=1 Tax=Brucella anthropi TaxID=529 RepID=UPI001266FF29|nr:site-specific integrase [Brucella anthropi]
MGRRKLLFKIIPLFVDGGKYQFLLICRCTGKASDIGSMYGAHLALTSRAQATAKKAMQHAAEVLSWIGETANGLDVQLARGKPLARHHILGFKKWLGDRHGSTATKTTPQTAGTVNASLAGARQFINWCVMQGGEHDLPAIARYLEELDNTWATAAKERVPSTTFADDFDDDEIRQIETYLFQLAFPAGQVSARASDFRTYLMWRLAIEFGLRIGEILALREVDLPSPGENYLKIVRTEYRDGLVDPRGVNAPRVKTLGRDLGYRFKNTRFPELFNQYRIQHRWAWAMRKSGRRYQQTKLPHPYLLISSSGAPLSMSRAEQSAAEISQATGIDFRWHRARHSFFNRVYVATMAISDTAKRQDGLKGLVYWGGWACEDSLDIYTRTARRNQARKAAFTMAGEFDKPLFEALGRE